MLHDADIREPLFDYLDVTYGKIRIIEEKNMGRSRADVVMVTETALYGLEIKSDADTYVRLARQVKDYDKFYDYNIVVVGTTHAQHIKEHVPDYWGVITVEEVEGELDFYYWRRPRPNPKCQLEQKLKLLWRPELALLQEWNNMPKYKEKGKPFVLAKIIERTQLDAAAKNYIDQAALERQICELLLERDYTTVEETLQEYRKGEITKELEKKETSQQRLEYMVEQAAKGRIISKSGLKKTTRRRKNKGD